MIISLAFLAPNLVKAATEGRLPHGIGVTRLTDLPAEWSRQHHLLGLTEAVVPYRTESLALSNQVSAVADVRFRKRFSDAGDEPRDWPQGAESHAGRDQSPGPNAASLGHFSPNPGNLRSIAAAWWARGGVKSRRRRKA